MNHDEMPEGWELINLESTCEILDHKRIPLNSDERYDIKGNIPYYGANGVIDYISNYIFDENLILMAEDGGYFDEYDTTTLGNDVWIGSHAFIKGGIVIGNGAVIGAYSVVTKDVEPYSIVAGNPAKFIRKRFDNETISKLMESRWWELEDDALYDNATYFTNAKHFLKNHFKQI